LPFALRQIKRDPAQTLMISLLHRTASSKTRATPPIRHLKAALGGVALFAAQREAPRDRHSSALFYFFLPDPRFGCHPTAAPFWLGAAAIVLIVAFLGFFFSRLLLCSPLAMSTSFG
jgi:hypothetical protein